MLYILNKKLSNFIKSSSLNIFNISFTTRNYLSEFLHFLIHIKMVIKIQTHQLLCAIITYSKLFFIFLNIAKVFHNA